MAIMYIDCINGADANDGLTFSTPKKYWNALSGTFSDIRVCSNVSATTNIGNALWTYNSATVSATTGHGLSAQDLISPDNGDTWYRVTVTATNNITIANVFCDSTITASTIKLTPSVITISTTQSRMIAGLTNGTSNAYVNITFGWDSSATQNGYCVYDQAGTGSDAFINIDNVAKRYFNIDGCNRLLYSRALQNNIITRGDVIITRCKFINPQATPINMGTGTAGTNLIISDNYHIGVTGIYNNINIGNNAIQIINNKIYSPAITSVVSCGTNGIVKNNIIKTTTRHTLIDGRYAKNTLFDSDNTFDTSATATIFITFGQLSKSSMIFNNIKIPTTINSMMTNIISVGRFSRAKFINYDQTSGDHRCYIDNAGVLIRNLGAANVTLPTNITDIVECRMDIDSTWQMTTIPVISASTICTSLTTFPSLVEDSLNLTFDKSATIIFRNRVNSKINNLTKDMFYMEIIRNNSTIIRSNNAAITSASSNSDWTQAITTSAIAYNANEIISINWYFNFYSTTQYIYIAPLEYSTNGGSTWIQCDYGWDRGEIKYQLPSNGSVVADTKLNTVYGRYNELVGTLAAGTGTGTIINTYGRRPSNLGVKRGFR